MPLQSPFRFPPVALSKGRIEALTDGIFAIAMTLLVLELKLPDSLPRHIAQHELLEHIKELVPRFVSFGFTFFLAGVFWFFHHLVFHFVRHVTRILIWLNVAFLMFVSLLPFSTAMMGQFSIQTVPILFYFGNQFILAAIMKIQWTYATKAGLVNPESDPQMQQRISTRLMIMVLAHASAMAMALYDARQSFNTFVIVLILGNVIVKRMKRAVSTQPLTELQD